MSRGLLSAVVCSLLLHGLILYYWQFAPSRVVKKTHVEFKLVAAPTAAQRKMPRPPRLPDNPAEPGRKDFLRPLRNSLSKADMEISKPIRTRAPKLPAAPPAPPELAMAPALAALPETIPVPRKWDPDRAVTPVALSRRHQVPETGVRGATKLQAYLAALRARIEKKKRYPRSARRAGVSGRVRVRFHLSAGGILERVAVVASSGYESLDQAAVRAVREALPIRPPTGVDVGSSNMEIVINFNLL